MSKTMLTVVTALAISVLSLALIMDRWYVLGDEIGGTPGTAVWRVTVEVEGELTTPDASVTTVLPPDFRRQHVLDETFESPALAHKVGTARDGGVRRAVWKRRADAGQARRFHLAYSFRCVSGMRRPTPGMVQRTLTLDAAPGGRAQTRPGPLIESEHPDVAALAAQLVGAETDAAACAELVYEHVAHLPAGEDDGALDCLHAETGSELGKARLLVACCRNRGIPARLVTGLLPAAGAAPLHHWAEAWVGTHWLPLDPARGRFGPQQVGDDYLVLRFGDRPVRGSGATFTAAFHATDLHNSLAPGGGAPASLAKQIWRRLSLGNLRPEEQAWVQFLLLLPVAALAVSFFRTVIGITTFGVFGPALLGLVCRDPKDFPWALGLFVGILMAGWGVRKLLDRYHLLMVPRISVLLTTIVLLLTFGALLLGPYSGVAHGYVALLPLIILTHMVERFWTVETEDGPAASFKTLLGTVTVAVAITLLVNFDLPVNAAARLFKRGPLVRPNVVRTTLFRFPEALGLVLAGQLLLGRYTGYRLTELFRFRDLLVEEDDVEPAGPRPATAGTGHPGDEPAQHGVHPRPQPAGALPPGGRQEAHA